MAQIIECVPNFSEGRNMDIINAISESIKKVNGISLLDVDPGSSTNRTVITFVGSPDTVIEAAIQAAKVAKTLIDMTKHKGSHQRLGAMDVCPFVPVSNVTMQDCIECANKFAQRMANELNLPCYLYEEACVKGDYRKSLRQLRTPHEYESLAEKLLLPEWEPDYGPKEFIPTWGVTCTGARNFLIAYNVNILGTKEQSHRIALNIREQGRGPGQEGKLKYVKGIGWYIPEYDLAQVSMNLDNYLVSPLHIAFEEVKNEATVLKLGTCGSEIVGLVPLQCMLMAAEYYIKKENLFILEESKKIKLVIDRLGLNSIKQFDPQTRIIDYIVEPSLKKPNQLVDLTLEGFIKSVQARTAAPGGGSVSACAASLGAALANMMAFMSYGNKAWEKYDQTMRELIPTIYPIVGQLISCVDKDTEAFDAFLKAKRLPQNTEDEKKYRDQQMELGMKQATLVPVTTIRLASNPEMWKSILVLAEIGNINSASDLEVGCKMLEAGLLSSLFFIFIGVWGAFRNVLINTPNVSDSQFVQEILLESQNNLSFVQAQVQLTVSILDKRKK